MHGSIRKPRRGSSPDRLGDCSVLLGGSGSFCSVVSYMCRDGSSISHMEASKFALFAHPWFDFGVFLLCSVRGAPATNPKARFQFQEPGADALRLAESVAVCRRRFLAVCEDVMRRIAAFENPHPLNPKPLTLNPKKASGSPGCRDGRRMSYGTTSHMTWHLLAPGTWLRAVQACAADAERVGQTGAQASAN